MRKMMRAIVVKLARSYGKEQCRKLDIASAMVCAPQESTRKVTKGIESSKERARQPSRSAPAGLPARVANA